jgi:hypothetical protein
VLIFADIAVHIYILIGIYFGGAREEEAGSNFAVYYLFILFLFLFFLFSIFGRQKAHILSEEAILFK